MKKLAAHKLSRDDSGDAEVLRWQPIETAPKDSSTVLLYSPDAAETRSIFLGFWVAFAAEPGGGSWWETEDSHFCIDADPSHWMPLPEPPRSAEVLRAVMA